MSESTTAIRSSSADTALGTVEYADSGTGHPVLVLHGSPGGIDQAEAMARFLPRDRFRVILVSRPGYLGTPLGAHPGIDAEADLLAALLDTLGIDRVGVLAWSGGGPSGYRLAVRHPGRVSALVMVAAVSEAIVVPPSDLPTRLMFATTPGSWLIKVLAAHQPKQLISGVLSSEGSLTKEQLTERVEQVFADDAKRQFVIDLNASVRQDGSRKAGYRNDCARFAEIESLELDKVTVPVLLVHGTVDTDAPPTQSTDAAAVLPDAELMMLETGTHLAFFTHPDADKAQARAIEVLSR